MKHQVSSNTFDATTKIILSLPLVPLNSFLLHFFSQLLLSVFLCSMISSFSICFADAVENFQSGCFKILTKFRHFFYATSKFWAFPPEIFLNFRQLLPSYFQSQDFSSRLLPRFTQFFQELAKSDIIFQDLQETCKNIALSSNILEVKSNN